MMRSITASLAAACCVALLAFAPTPKPTTKPLLGTVWGLINVYNASNKAAWTDVSWSYKGQGWHIQSPAVCLKPGEYYNWKIDYNHPVLGPQVRVRAEVKPGSADCGGGNVAWPQNDMNLDFPWRVESASVSARIEGTASYSVSIKQETRR